MRFLLAPLCVIAGILFAGGEPADAQPRPGGPPVVGVTQARKQPVTESQNFIGRVQATDRVDLVARVTAYLEQMLFTEGAEVKQGDLLYRLERPPFEADVMAKQGAVQQTAALLRNAAITLRRAEALLNTPAGQQSTVDDALAQQGSLAAQLLSAQAQLRISQINLDYTEIRAPISGRITRTTVTVGNVVSPSSGRLATIVSQDPMYVLFPVSTRTAMELRDRYAEQNGFDAMAVKLILPDGKEYDQVGKIDYTDPTVATTTDTLTWRASIPNPRRADGQRDLVDGEFVTVVVEGVKPVMALGIPRAAVLSDQLGSYVYVVGAGNKVEQRRIELGQSTLAVAVVVNGLKEGETVIADGLQRVRPGVEVNPAPITAGPAGGPASSATPGKQAEATDTTGAPARE